MKTPLADQSLYLLQSRRDDGKRRALIWAASAAAFWLVAVTLLIAGHLDTLGALGLVACMLACSFASGCTFGRSLIARAEIQRRLSIDVDDR